MSASRRKIWCAILILGALCWSSTAAAQDIRLPVQGLLTDASGTPLDESVAIEFALYDNPKATDASWSGTVMADVEGGLFTVYLGVDNPLSATLLRDATAPELSMKIKDDEDVLGRWPIGSAPLAGYAALAGDAQTLQGKTPSELIGAGSIVGEQIADGSVEAVDLKQTYAGGVSPGGPAISSSDLACSGCVSESEVSFSWAASSTPGGAASSSDDLACSGCVSTSELDFDPAEQTELDDHKTGGDHDARYVDTAGDTMNGVLNLPGDGLTVAGSQLVLSGGNVGIGTSTPSATLEVNGTLKAKNTACDEGFAHVTGDKGICIQTTLKGEAGCYGDECSVQGYRNCTCFQITKAFINGRITPTRATDVGDAGEYCVTDLGHGQGPSQSGYAEGTSSNVGISKIWPHLEIQRDSNLLPDKTWPGYYAWPAVATCDQSLPAAHSGSPYGGYRCCY
ncbi:MAG: hypothetical protein VB934_04040 [Polyangiaceae bacterium]